MHSGSWHSTKLHCTSSRLRMRIVTVTQTSLGVNRYCLRTHVHLAALQLVLMRRIRPTSVRVATHLERNAADFDTVELEQVPPASRCNLQVPVTLTQPKVHARVHLRQTRPK